MKIILGNAPIKNGNRGCVALTITIACMIDEIMKKAGLSYELYLSDSQYDDRKTHEILIGDHKIEFKVIPNSLFWSSDLDGGVYLLDINIVPIDPKCKDYIKMNYCFYTPILLEEYKNNIKVKSTALSSYSSHSIQL